MTIREAEALASFINEHDCRYTASMRSAPGADALVVVHGFEPGRGRIVFLYQRVCDYLSSAWGKAQEDEAFQSALHAWDSSGFRRSPEAGTTGEAVVAPANS